MINRARPWDKQLEPVELFMIRENWFSANPMRNGYHRYLNQGNFCGQFVDKIMHINAERFDNNLGHLVYTDMETQWNSFCGSNDHCESVNSATYKAKQQKQQQNQQKQQQQQQQNNSLSVQNQKPWNAKSWAVWNRSGAPKSTKRADNMGPSDTIDQWTLGPAGSQWIEVTDMCRAFNHTKCNNRQFDANTHCCKNATTGREELHICNVPVLYPGNRREYPCGQPHSAKDHPN